MKFRQAAGLLAVGMLVVSPLAHAQRRRSAAPPPSAPVMAFSEGGYADRSSVVQGGKISFSLASSASPVDVQIVNRARTSKVLMTLTKLNAPPRSCDGLYAVGCHWPATATIQIPPSWPSGYYAAMFTTSRGLSYIPFIVRAANPGNQAPMLIVSGTNTWVAYNNFGGKNVYPSNSPARSPRVSFDRPFADQDGLGRMRSWDQPFLDWLENEQRPYEVASDVDLEDPTLLAHYRAVVLVGHLEYWTLNARANLDKFNAAGGHIAIFAGNTMWWQIRYEDNGRTLVVYKEATSDPEMSQHPERVTVNWYDWPLFNPENSTIGSSFRYGGFANATSENATPGAGTRTGYTVADAASWVFANTGMKNGQTFGELAAGTEVDGVLYNCTQAGLEPDGSDATPRNFHIVAATPGSYGHGVIGYMVNAAGGAVFNAGTRQWAAALASDSIVQAITRNVLNRMTSGERFVPDVVPADGVRMRDLFNCPSLPAAPLPGWTGDVAKVTLSPRCGYEGPAGLELGSDNATIDRNFAPRNETLMSAEVRLYLNADGFNRAKDSSMTLVTLQNRVRQVRRQFLQLQIVITGSGRAVRLVQLRETGGAEASSSLVNLAAGWNSIRIGWNSPGTISLQVGTGTPVTLNNVHGDQPVNEIILSYKTAGTADYACIDALALGKAPLPDTPALRY